MQEYVYMAPEPEKKAVKKPGRIKIRYSNRIKVLLCYAISFGLAFALPVVGLMWIFPFKLVGTAPSIAESLATAFPGLAGWLERAIRAATLAEGMSPQALADVLNARDLQWRAFVGGLSVLLWGISLLTQLGWRSLYTRPLGIARAARSAVRTYRFAFLCILLLNGLGGMLVYFFGMQFIGGRTLWDWLLYMDGFALNTLAAFACFRLAAPPAISGKHAFFKRL